MTDPAIRELICVDCGEWFRLVAPPDLACETCGPCAWLRETTDPAERARIRALIHRRSMDDG